MEFYTPQIGKSAKAIDLQSERQRNNYFENDLFATDNHGRRALMSNVDKYSQKEQ